jgi:acyl carrier protein
MSTLEKVKTIYQKIMGSKAISLSKIDINSRLFDDLMMTSITILMMVIAIQDEFKIKLPNLSDMRTLTIKQVIDVIDKLVGHER